MASPTTPAELQQTLIQLINEFFENERKLNNSVRLMGSPANNVAESKGNNEIKMTPDIGYSDRMQTILNNRLHLDNADFTRTNQRKALSFTRSDDFIIKPDQFNKVFDNIKKALEEQRKIMADREAIVSIVQPNPPPESFIRNRTPPIPSAKSQSIPIPGWNLSNETKDPNVDRFTQSTDRNNFINVDRITHKISSSSASTETFTAMITAFQHLHGKNAVPSITLTGDKNTVENRENCQEALKKAGYGEAAIHKMMAPLASSASPPLPIPTQEALKNLVHQFIENDKALNKGGLFEFASVSIENGNIVILPEYGQSNKVESLLVDTLGMGKTDFTRNDRGWRASDDFVIKPERFAEWQQQVTKALVTQQAEMQEKGIEPPTPPSEGQSFRS